jgi:hypothetical protein
MGIVGCCARVGGGHAIAAPPSRTKNSRRLIGFILMPRAKPNIMRAFGHAIAPPPINHFNETSPSYSITSSANNKNESRTVRPSAFAVLRSTTS